MPPVARDGVCSVPPVQGDAAQVEDGGGGEQHVQRGAHQAEGLPVDPVLLEQLDGPERHHQNRDQQVGKGQRHDEVVGLDLPDGGGGGEGERRVGEEGRRGGEKRGGGERRRGEEERSVLTTHPLFIMR